MYAGYHLSRYFAKQQCKGRLTKEDGKEIKNFIPPTRYMEVDGFLAMAANYLASRGEKVVGFCQGYNPNSVLILTEKRAVGKQPF